MFSLEGILNLRWHCTFNVRPLISGHNDDDLVGGRNMGCGRRVSPFVSNSSAHPVAKEREIEKKVDEGFIVHGFFLSTVSVSSICLTGALEHLHRNVKILS